MWREQEAPEIVSPLQDCYDRLTRLRKPIGSINHQIIHGDLNGNVLFTDNLPPAILDFSPYWRPREFAEAVIITDGLLDEGEGENLIELVGESYLRMQLLLRALILRLVSWSDLSKTYPLLLNKGYENSF